MTGNTSEMQARRVLRALAVAWSVSTLGANASAFELAWSAPPDCPDRTWAEARLRDEAEGELASSSLEARVQVAPQGASWIVRIEAIQAGRRGVRRLEGASCRELAEAAVVIIAMTLRDDDDALATSDAWQEESPSDETTTPPPAPAVDSTSAAFNAERAPHPEERSAWFARVGALFDVGTLPHPRPGLSAQFGRRFGEWWLDARFSALFPATTQLSSNTSIGGRFSSADGLVALCFAPRLGEHVEGSLCAAAGLGLLFAEGFGVPDARSTTRLQFVTQAELGVTFSFARDWSLRPAVAAFLPVDRQSYAIENAGTLYTPELVSLRTSLCLGFDF